MCVAALTCASCLARSEATFHPAYEDDAGGPRLVDGTTTPDEPLTNLPPADPHAVLSVDPPQGPFSGGRTVLVRGNGFTSDVRVWFGDQRVPRADVTPVDAHRVQVVTPPGGAGAVDVTAQNGDDTSTRRTLAAGYSYDPFEVTPAAGPTGGGTVLTIRGQKTSWTRNTEVLIDFEPCAHVERLSPTELTCQTPAAAPGTQPVRVRTGDETLTVLDAFTYGDTDDGFQGGLSGAPIEGQLTVIALNAFTGQVLGDVVVVLGDDLASAQRTDRTGVVRYEDADLESRQTITLARDCYQPLTLVDVSVDTVTAYLDPVLAPACGDRGDLPALGGSGGSSLGAQVAGELIWPNSVEFRREGWTNVPPPQFPGEERVAYLFRSNTSATAEFRLPDADEAVTPTASGLTGFAFEMALPPGTYTLYALAGIENRERTPPTFTAYSMGVTQGVTARVDQSAAEVFIKVNIPLDHAISLDVTGPTPTQRGPDRIVTHAAVRLVEREHLILPVGHRSIALPSTEPVQIVGLPPLAEALARAEYVVSARAVTGQNEGDPSSTVGLFASSTEGLAIEGFVEVPRLVTPEPSGNWDAQHVAVTWPPGGPPVALTVVEAQSGDGLVNWTIVMPEGVQETNLPDLAALDDDLGLLPGPVTFVVSVASISGFDYGALRYRQLGRGGWDAYARDTFHVRY